MAMQAALSTTASRAPEAMLLLLRATVSATNRCSEINSAALLASG